MQHKQGRKTLESTVCIAIDVADEKYEKIKLTPLLCLLKIKLVNLGQGSVKTEKQGKQLAWQNWKVTKSSHQHPTTSVSYELNKQKKKKA